jgi:hypothetical protein
MTPKAWFCAFFGFLFAMSILIAIGYDIEAVQRGWMTISRWCLNVGSEYPVVPALVGIFLGLVMGTLLGHLWFPQYK